MIAAPLHPIWQSFMSESHDQSTDKKEDMTAGWGSVTDDEEQPL